MSIPPEAARITDPTTCSHSGNAIATGYSTVLICGQPAARITNSSGCGGVVTSGEASVLIGGQPAARRGDSTTHGCIQTGCSTVLIGKPAPGNCLAEAGQEGTPFVEGEEASEEALKSAEPPKGCWGPLGPGGSSGGLSRPDFSLPGLEGLGDTNLLEMLGGEDLSNLIGGENTVNALGIVNQVCNTMGIANPLSPVTEMANLVQGGNVFTQLDGLANLTGHEELGRALNLAGNFDQGNALTQAGGIMTLLGHDDVAQELHSLGNAVGGGNPTTLLAAAASLIGEDQVGELLNTKTSSDVMTLLEEQPASLIPTVEDNPLV